jgi:hypothetical protein
MKRENEYWISEYVITKNDSAVRGIYISKERFNPDKLEHFLAIYSYRHREDKKIGFPKRSQRIHLLRKLMSIRNNYEISAEIGKECVNDISDFNIFRCNVEKANFEVLQKLKVKLKDSEAEDCFDEFFKEYERS